MKKTSIYSVFGQIDAVVAQAMVEEGKLNMIVRERIPLTALFNEKGEAAQFAVIVPSHHENEFNERCRKLRM